MDISSVCVYPPIFSSGRVFFVASIRTLTVSSLARAPLSSIAAKTFDLWLFWQSARGLNRGLGLIQDEKDPDIVKK